MVRNDLKHFVITNFIILTFVILVLFAVSSVPSYAASGQYPVLSGYVNDYARLLSSEEISNLSTVLSMIEKNTSVQIIILTLNSTSGEDRVLYANHVGEKNGIGSKEKDNGLVILWSMDNEKGGAIAPGRGLEAQLNDAKVARIGRESRQYFDNGQYYNGFVLIISRIQEELGQTPSMQLSSDEGNENGSSELLFIVLIFLIIIVISTIQRKGKNRYYGPGRALSYVGWGIAAGSWKGKGGFGGNIGGFGGFGGGSFGGGGGKF